VILGRMGLRIEFGSSLGVRRKGHNQGSQGSGSGVVIGSGLQADLPILPCRTGIAYVTVAWLTLG